MPLTQVQDMADTRLAQKISQLPGVGLVSLAGGQKPGYRIRANPTALAAYGLNVDDLRTTISNANVNTPKGNFDGPTRAYTINANDQITDPKMFNDLIVAYRNGAPVRLCDVADVRRRPGEQPARRLGERRRQAVIVNVQRQPGANVIAVVDSIKALLPTLRETLPPSFDVTVLTDRTLTIRASVHDVEFELVVRRAAGGGGDLPLPAATGGHLHPQPVGAAVAGRHVRGDVPAGFSLNNLSLMALTIATGFVVDDAIVMIENIARYIEEGEDPLAGGAEGRGADRLHHHLADRVADRGADPAAVHGRRGRPAVPRVRHHAGGHHPDLGGGLADPGADAVRAAAARSATTPERPGAPAASEALGARWFDRMIARYDRGLIVVFRHQTLTLIVAVGTLALTVLLYIVIPKGLFPVQDTGLIQASPRRRRPCPTRAWRAPARSWPSVILKDPDVESLTSFIGVDGTNTTLNFGRMLINLKPRDARTPDAPARSSAACARDAQSLAGHHASTCSRCRT